MLQIIQRYNKARDQMAHLWQLGWPQSRALSFAEERELLSTIENDALNGYILTCKQTKSKVEEKAGKQVSDDYIWDLFSRHHWKKERHC